METKLQYIDIYLHNENVLEYGLLLVGSGRFMIFHIEGRSNTVSSGKQDGLISKLEGKKSVLYSRLSIFFCTYTFTSVYADPGVRGPRSYAVFL